MAKQRLEQPRGAEEVEAGIQALPRREALVNFTALAEMLEKPCLQSEGLEEEQNGAR